MKWTERNTLRGAIVAAAILVLPGCFWGFADPEPQPDPEPIEEPEEDRTNPTIDDVELPDWPPLGPDGVIAVEVWDNEFVDRVGFDFVETYEVRDLAASSTIVEATGRDLGEGYGELGIRVWDEAGNWDTASVTDLLVDLTPPEYEIRSTLLGHRDGELEILVQDAFVLGSVKVEFQGERVAHDFPNTYPSGLGESWDRSLVTFPAASLPSGSGLATIEVRDAAGNVTRDEVELTLDALPPQVEIAEMPTGSMAEPFLVEIHVTDDTDVVPTATLLLSGTPVGDVVGESGLVEIDPLEFAPGEHELVATAVDASGNRGWSPTLTVTLE